MTHLPKYALPRLGKTELVAMVNNIFFDQVCFRLIFPFHKESIDFSVCIISITHTLLPNLAIQWLLNRDIHRGHLNKRLRL